MHRRTDHKGTPAGDELHSRSLRPSPSACLASASCCASECRDDLADVWVSGYCGGNGAQASEKLIHRP